MRTSVVWECESGCDRSTGEVNPRERGVGRVDCLCGVVLGVGWWVGCEEELVRVRGGHGAREQESLSDWTAEVAQGVELGALFDSLGDHVDLERATELHRRTHDSGAAGVEDGAGQGAVELECVERELSQASESLVLDPLAEPTLAGLRRLGVRLALDDFGTGCTSRAGARR